MLDNGITLNSTIEVQNGECNVTGCWGGQGNADTFTNVLTIKDNEGNVLASNTNVRTDVTGINGANFTDTLIYTGTGSNVGNINMTRGAYHVGKMRYKGGYKRVGHRKMKY